MPWAMPNAPAGSPGEHAAERQLVGRHAGPAVAERAVGQGEVVDRAVVGHERAVDDDVLAAGALQTDHLP